MNILAKRAMQRDTIRRGSGGILLKSMESEAENINNNNNNINNSDDTHKNANDSYRIDAILKNSKNTESSPFRASTRQ